MQNTHRSLSTDAKRICRATISTAAGGAKRGLSIAAQSGSTLFIMGWRSCAITLTILPRSAEPADACANGWCDHNDEHVAQFVQFHCGRPEYDGVGPWPVAQLLQRARRWRLQSDAADWVVAGVVSGAHAADASGQSLWTHLSCTGAGHGWPVLHGRPAGERNCDSVVNLHILRWPRTKQGSMGEFPPTSQYGAPPAAAYPAFSTPPPPAAAAYPAHGSYPHLGAAAAPPSPAMAYAGGAQASYPSSPPPAAAAPSAEPKSNAYSQYGAF